MAIDLLITFTPGDFRVRPNPKELHKLPYHKIYLGSHPEFNPKLFASLFKNWIQIWKVTMVHSWKQVMKGVIPKICED